MIDKFDGEYAFLSNFFEVPVNYNGLLYRNSEAAFQAQKTINQNERLQFVNLNASHSKRLGRTIELRKDWESIKIRVMYEICLAKFSQNPELAKKLIKTGDNILIEGNTWNDTFWGVCNGEGRNNLGKILMRIRAELSFDAVKVKENVVKWIKDIFETNGKGCNAVVGISGGKDSSVVAALCVEALGKEKVIGVLMPNGVQNDISDSVKLVEHLGIKYLTVNISDAYNGVINEINSIFIPERDGYEDIVISEQTKVNLPARIRMSTLYAVSQSMNGRVMNTCNLSEDWVGYSTRYGDAAGDFSPISSLTSGEVVKIGKVCGLPDELIYKAPSDGLCGKTDEDNLGFTYDVLNTYIRTGICDNDEIKDKIDLMHNKNKFKLLPMPKYEYNPND